MASGTGYDAAVTPVVSHFDKEQRARLEAVTFARKLLKTSVSDSVMLPDWLRLADYIIKGER